MRRMHALETENLSKIYRGPRGERRALDGVSLVVPEGSFFALLGPNGAGKSTLINILADTVRHDGGRARLFGRDLFAERSWCKRRMGVVPQEIAFDPFFSPREILGIASGWYGQRPDWRWIDELLERLELSEHAGKITRQLSGGMRRRLLIAQALVHRPGFVILDEPTAGVDVELRRRLWDFMREMNRNGTTILLTTHYLEEAQELCEHVAILDRGRLLTACPMRELMNEVADSRLWLRYARLPEEAALRRLLPDLDVRVRDGLLCVPLSRSGDRSNFHELYRRVTDALGAPLDAGVSREDLEDVFLRLTGNGEGADGRAHDDARERTREADLA